MKSNDLVWLIIPLILLGLVVCAVLGMPVPAP
jgi:hypothetical protein